MRIVIIIRNSVLSLLACWLLAGCKKDFQTINTDPNRSTAALPEQLLTQAVYGIVNANQSRSLRLNNELMQDQVTTDNTNEFHRYIIRPSESDFMWNNWYTGLTDIKDMGRRAAALQQKTYMGISLILQVWVSSLLTDVFGDVPYTQANRGRDSIYMPAFDRQKDIYTDFFVKLDSANNLLAANQTLTSEQMALDALYGGDITKWRKFGNSLYLRLLLRVSGKAGMNAGARISAMLGNASQYPVFTSNADAAILRFTLVPPYTSEFNTYRPYDFNGSTGLTQFFINNLMEWNDPRIAKWATQVSGTYAGIPSGYLPSNVPSSQSVYPLALKDEPLLGNIMNYSELQFLLAEAAVKGYITGSAQSYYESGITNGLLLWGFSLPAGYLSTADIQWDDTQSTDSKMEKIMVQKYYSLFFTDFQQWIEYRRTGHPVLPKGPGLQNNGMMPSRFKYPVAVQSLNKANYQAAVAAMGGPDDLNTKMWWNQ